MIVIAWEQAEKSNLNVNIGGVGGGGGDFRNSPSTHYARTSISQKVHFKGC